MSRALSFILFLTVVLAVYGGMHLFVYQRIANGLGLGNGWRLALKIGLAVAALTFILGEAGSRFAWVQPLLAAGSTWLGVLAIAVSAFLLERLVALVGWGSARNRTLAALAAVLLVSAWSLFNGLRPPVVRSHTVSLPGLPAGMSGFSIVQVSDMHLGSLRGARWLAGIVAAVNRLRPDLVAVTGDLLDRDVCAGSDVCQALAELRATHGVVAVTGNHEFYAGIDAFLEVARRYGWTVLRNRSVEIGGLVVAGLDDDAGRQMGGPGPDLRAALAGVERGRPCILLYHRPTRFAAARAAGVELQLSGHTHAGQVPPMDLLVFFAYRFPAGLYRREAATIHTSPGTGTWGPPMRFLSRSEITRLVLQPVNPEGAEGTASAQ